MSSEVTLEDVAVYHERKAQSHWKKIRKAIESDKSLSVESESRWHQERHQAEAALVRAAAEVVEAAKELWALQLRTPTTEAGKDYFRMDAAEAMCRLGLALAAFDKISQGEPT